MGRFPLQIVLVLRFYCPANPMVSCLAQSDYLTTLLMGRHSPQTINPRPAEPGYNLFCKQCRFSQLASEEAN